jgi:hypothetical protein
MAEVRALPVFPIRRFLSGRLGAVRLAIVLALLALPGVSWHFMQPDRGAGANEPLPSLLASTGSVVAAAIVGGWLGGLVSRRRPLGGGLVALVVAWPIAIAGLPLLPTLAGGSFQTAWFSLTGLGGGDYVIKAGDLFSGVRAAFFATVVPGGVVVASLQSALSGSVVYFGGSCSFVIFSAPCVAYPIVLVLLGLATVAMALLGRSRKRIRLAAFIGAVATVTLAQLPSVSYAPLPYALLVVGVLIWAVALRRSSASMPDQMPGSPPSA